jgi:hypothetical protein
MYGNARVCISLSEEDRGAVRADGVGEWASMSLHKEVSRVRLLHWVTLDALMTWLCFVVLPISGGVRHRNLPLRFA